MSQDNTTPSNFSQQQPINLFEWAKTIATAHYRIFPCYYDPVSGKKPPRIKDGFKQATDDIKQIEVWKELWLRPDTLIGMITGEANQLNIMDLDPKNNPDLYALIPDWQSLTPKIIKTPSGGYHLYFRYDPNCPIKSTTGSSKTGIGHGIDTRGEGGYVIIPPSMINGIGYVNFGEKKNFAPHDLPTWPEKYLVESIRLAAKTKPSTRGATKVSQSSKERDSEWALRYLQKACDEIKNAESGSRNSTLNAVAHSVGKWIGSDALDYKDAYEKLHAAALENPYKPPLEHEEVDFTINHAFREGMQTPIHAFEEKASQSANSLRSVRSAVRQLDLTIEHNEFSHRTIVSLEGFPKGELNDLMAVRIREIIHDEFGFYPNKNLTEEVLMLEAIRNSYHPVKDYLNKVVWDGTSRVDNWLTVYGQADDTPYTRAVGRIVLLAAVLRIFKPGIKFDNMIILEGPQGIGKSTAWNILAVEDEWFADNVSFKLETPRLMEVIRGRWLIEFSELKGMRDSQTDHVKNLLSSRRDSHRLAFDKHVTDMPRQSIFVGTTNENTYLSDRTGNRRFWPVKVGRWDLSSLLRDRDQIWAEVVYLINQGATLNLDEGLWDSASAEQDERVVEEPYVELLKVKLGALWGRVAKVTLYNILNIPHGAILDKHAQRVGTAMHVLGWYSSKSRFEKGHSPLEDFYKPIHGRKLNGKDPQEKIEKMNLPRIVMHQTQYSKELIYHEDDAQVILANTRVDLLDSDLGKALGLNKEENTKS